MGAKLMRFGASRNWLLLVLALVLLATLTYPAASNSASAAQTFDATSLNAKAGLTTSRDLVAAPDKPITTNSVGIQMFMWPWVSLTTECSNVLGPEGVDWIMVSPPQEDVSGNQWWTHYQPVSYQINSQLGTEAQFAQMVSSCNRAGVQVVVDAVINHMANSSGTGFAGSQFTKYSYPGLYATDDFHAGLAKTDPNYCGVNIADYSNQWEVTHCELGGLPDLATEKSNVQAAIVGYLNHLVALGVSGFRIDAAKHIGIADLSQILKQVNLVNNRPPYVVSEVVGGPIDNEDFKAVGDVFSWNYPTELNSFFGTGGAKFTGLLRLRTTALDTPQNSITMVSNHDTERAGTALTYSSPKQFELASIFDLADTAGKPMLYTGFAYNPLVDSAGPTANADTTILPAKCPTSGAGPLSKYSTGQFICLQRWTAIRGMIQFHHAVGDAPMTQIGGVSNAFWFSRGAGFIAINNGPKAVSAAAKTSLPAGKYCDLISGGATASSSKKCAGTTISVNSKGVAAIKLAATTAVAIDTGVFIK